MRPGFFAAAPRPLAIAHRGGALLGPENTAEAFAASAGVGAGLPPYSPAQAFALASVRL